MPACHSSRWPCTAHFPSRRGGTHCYPTSLTPRQRIAASRQVCCLPVFQILDSSPAGSKGPGSACDRAETGPEDGAEPPCAGCADGSVPGWTERLGGQGLRGPEPSTRCSEIPLRSCQNFSTHVSVLTGTD